MEKEKAAAKTAKWWSGVLPQSSQHIWRSEPWAWQVSWWSWAPGPTLGSELSRKKSVLSVSSWWGGWGCDCWLGKCQDVFRGPRVLDPFFTSAVGCRSSRSLVLSVRKGICASEMSLLDALALDLWNFCGSEVIYTFLEAL